MHFTFFFLQECIQYILLDTGIHAIHFIKKELNNNLTSLYHWNCWNSVFVNPKQKTGCVQILFGLGKKDLAIPLKQGWLLIGGTVPHAGVSCGLLRPPQRSRILFHPGNCRANTRCSALQRWITYILMVTYDAPEQVMFQIGNQQVWKSPPAVKSILWKVAPPFLEDSLELLCRQWSLIVSSVFIFPWFLYTTLFLLSSMNLFICF